MKKIIERIGLIGSVNNVYLTLGCPFMSWCTHIFG